MKRQLSWCAPIARQPFVPPGAPSPRGWTGPLEPVVHSFSTCSAGIRRQLAGCCFSTCTHASAVRTKYALTPVIVPCCPMVTAIPWPPLLGGSPMPVSTHGLQGHIHASQRRLRAVTLNIFGRVLQWTVSETVRGLLGAAAGREPGGRLPRLLRVRGWPAGCPALGGPFCPACPGRQPQVKSVTVPDCAKPCCRHRPSLCMAPRVTGAHAALSAQTNFLSLQARGRARLLLRAGAFTPPDHAVSPLQSSLPRLCAFPGCTPPTAAAARVTTLLEVAVISPPRGPVMPA